MDSLKYWNTKDFEIASFKFNLSDRVNNTYNTSGSDNSGKCTYTYNELGFRGDTPSKNGFKVMSIGCSITEGVGVNDNETWPHQLCKLIPNAVDLNFGCGGRSNDYISRCLLSFYDYVQPDLVLIMYTEPHRREFYTADGGIEPFYYNPWGYFSEDEGGTLEHTSLLNLSNTHSDFQNWYKNHLVISNFLKTKKCKWVWNGWFINNIYSDINRFDGDFFPFIDYGVDNSHPGPITNKQYAKKIYNYLYK
jgi:hypothetical protein